MKFILEIELGNDAMDTSEDVARALRQTATKVRDYSLMQPGETGRIMDANGNSVGRWRVAGR